MASYAIKGLFMHALLMLINGKSRFSNKIPLSILLFPSILICTNVKNVLKSLSTYNTLEENVKK